MSRFASLYRYWEAGLTLGISSACLLLSLEAIFEYYLFKPHFLRLFFRLAGFFSALILALIAMYSRRAILNEFAWFTVVTTFVVSETIIWHWRRQRDANLPTQDGVPVPS